MKTRLRGGVLWHLHRVIVHQGAEQIQKAHRKEQERHHPIQEAGRHRQRPPEKMWILR